MSDGGTPFLLAYSPGVAEDRGALSVQFATEVVAHIGKVARTGQDRGDTVPVALGEVAGVRTMWVGTAATGAQPAPEAVVFYTLHRIQTAAGEPSGPIDTRSVMRVLHIAQPADNAAYLASLEVVSQRLNPPGHRYGRAFSPGFGADLKTAKPDILAAIWTTINSMTAGDQGTSVDPFSGEALPGPASRIDPTTGKQLSVVNGMNLYGTRGMPFDIAGQAEPRFGIIYQVIPPAEGSKASFIHFIGAGLRRSMDLYKAVARRLSVRVAAEQRPERSRAAAAARRSTTGDRAQTQAAPADRPRPNGDHPRAETARRTR